MSKVKIPKKYKFEEALLKKKYQEQLDEAEKILEQWKKTLLDDQYNNRSIAIIKYDERQIEEYEHRVHILKIHLESF